jgi:hypothetical protein
MKTDLYQRVTDQIVSSLEQGVRPWMKPWNAEHAAGRITRPLRANGIPYQGINVLVLWSESVTCRAGSNLARSLRCRFVSLGACLKLDAARQKWAPFADPLAPVSGGQRNANLRGCLDGKSGQFTTLQRNQSIRSAGFYPGELL